MGEKTRHVTLFSSGNNELIIDSVSMAAFVRVHGQKQLVTSGEGGRLLSSEIAPRLYSETEFFVEENGFVPGTRRLHEGSKVRGWAEIALMAAQATLDAQRQDDVYSVYFSGVMHGLNGEDEGRELKLKAYYNSRYNASSNVDDEDDDDAYESEDDVSDNSTQEAIVNDDYNLSVDPNVSFNLSNREEAASSSHGNLVKVEDEAGQFWVVKPDTGWL